MTRARLIGVAMQDAVIDGLLLRSADPADLLQAVRQLQAGWAETIERLRAMPSLDEEPYVHMR